MENNNETTEKEVVYDRQIRLWGKKFQERLNLAKILVIGISGINIECMKNLVLAGIQVTLCPKFNDDSKNIETKFYESHFIYSFFKKNTSLNGNKISNEKITDYILNYLRGLNPYVTIDSISETTILDEINNLNTCSNVFLNSFNGIIISLESSTRENILALNMICRASNIGFFLSESVGVGGFFFQDISYPVDSKLEKINNYSSYYPSLSESLKFDIIDSKYSSTKKKKKKICRELIIVLALLNYKFNYNNIRTNFYEYASQLFEKVGYDMFSEDKLYINMWEKYQGVADPTSSSIIGGLLCQQIQNCIQGRNQDINYIIYEGINCNAYTFNLGIIRKSNSDSIISLNIIENIDK